MENLPNIQVIQNMIYIISSVMFIIGIKMLGKEATAVKGNYLSALAMLQDLHDVATFSQLVVPPLLLGMT